MLEKVKNDETFFGHATLYAKGRVEIDNDDIKSAGFWKNLEGKDDNEVGKYIKELHSRGVMLSIASKNDLKNALDGLNHPESEFKEKDFLSIKANWSDKAQNIQEISVKDLC